MQSPIFIEKMCQEMVIFLAFRSDGTSYRFVSTSSTYYTIKIQNKTSGENATAGAPPAPEQAPEEAAGQQY